jgi:hypothetical protein
MKKSQEIFIRHGGEPIALSAGDWRVRIRFAPPKVACRVVCEEVYQDLIAAADRVSVDDVE